MESSWILCLVMFVALRDTSASPVGQRREDISNLVTLLGKIQQIEIAKNANQPSGILDIANSAEPLSGFPVSTDSEDENNRDTSVELGFLGEASGPVNKRQGAWSYDYGLGGGRFGKRHYGDYGLGGGRFGRDVDHVDLSDGNDADTTS